MCSSDVASSSTTGIRSATAVATEVSSSTRMSGTRRCGSRLPAPITVHSPSIRRCVCSVSSAPSWSNRVSRCLPRGTCRAPWPRRGRPWRAAGRGSRCGARPRRAGARRAAAPRGKRCRPRARPSSSLRPAPPSEPRRGRRMLPVGGESRCQCWGLGSGAWTRSRRCSSSSGGCAARTLLRCKADANDLRLAWVAAGRVRAPAPAPARHQGVEVGAGVDHVHRGRPGRRRGQGDRRGDGDVAAPGRARGWRWRTGCAGR